MTVKVRRSRLRTPFLPVTQMVRKLKERIRGYKMIATKCQFVIHTGSRVTSW